MLTQSREPIARKTFSLDTQHARPNEIHDPLSGVPQERVDAHTLEVIRLLFKDKGLLFLAALLRQAQARQRAFPSIGVADCAVLTAKTKGSRPRGALNTFFRCAATARRRPLIP
jgi:hypothetical protein